MRISLVIVAAIALCSCESKNPPASGNDFEAPQSQAPQRETKEATVIVLDETQQRKGHLAVEPVRTKEVAGTVTIPGRLTNSEDETWRVGAIASGRIENISARVGDSVSAGQILGRIHSHEVHEARAGYQEALAEVQRAQAAEGYAKQRRDRAQKLLELRAGSRQDLESADADLRNTQAAIEKAQSEVEKEHAHLNIFHLPIDERASDSSQNDEEDDIPILAPAPGLILERKASVGSVVNSGDELFVITNAGSVWMIAAADEVDLSKLRPGQQVQVQVRAYPDREFIGRILKLGEKLDPDTRTLQIRILVPNQQGLLKPEMYATASLKQAGQHSAVFLPDEAVQDIDGVPAVFVRRGPNNFEPRTVKTGQHVDGATEILEGLNPGEAVVVKGGFLLKSQLLKKMIQDN
jgi:cobalt-zinc-cadmium efflux system membrane fusion protein